MADFRDGVHVRGAIPTWRDSIVLNNGIGVIQTAFVSFPYDYDIEHGEVYVASTLTMRLEFSEDEGVFQVRSVALEADFEVTSAHLREVRVAEAKRRAVSHLVYVRTAHDADPVTLFSRFGDEGIGFAKSRATAGDERPTESRLRLVGLVYGLAQISSEPPAKAVERAFGLTQRTAARWIARAKELGFLVRPSYLGSEEDVARSDAIKARWGDDARQFVEVTSLDFSGAVHDGDGNADV